MPSKLLTPRDHIRGFPATPEAYLALAAAKAKRAGRVLVESREALEPYVSHGCWVADCPNCAAGIAVHPEWPLAACLGVGCHRVYRTISLDDAWRDIEDVLARRPMQHQHWLNSAAMTRRTGRAGVRVPGETVRDLERENAVRGVR